MGLTRYLFGNSILCKIAVLFPPKPTEFLEEIKLISCPPTLISVITLPTPANVARNIYTLYGWPEFHEFLRSRAGCFLTNRVKVKKRADKTIERITNTSVDK